MVAKRAILPFPVVISQRKGYAVGADIFENSEDCRLQSRRNM